MNKEINALCKFVQNVVCTEPVKVRNTSWCRKRFGRRHVWGRIRCCSMSLHWALTSSTRIRWLGAPNEVGESLGHDKTWRNFSIFSFSVMMVMFSWSLPSGGWRINIAVKEFAQQLGRGEQWSAQFLLVNQSRLATRLQHFFPMILMRCDCRHTELMGFILYRIKPQSHTMVISQLAVPEDSKLHWEQPETKQNFVGVFLCLSVEKSWNWKLSPQSGMSHVF